MSGQPADGAGPGPLAPHCYRHPDRETYISCQRCGRPICPDCMRPASVGFHCPECVSEGAKSIRQPRTMAGGLLPGQVGRVTMVIIAINVAMYVLTIATGGNNARFFEWGAMLPNSAVGSSGVVLTGVDDGGYWRLLTSAFLHENLLHIAFNMYAIYVFGPMLEQLLGLRRFIAMYLTTAVAASVAVYILGPERGLTIGASGAVFGLFAVALILLVRRGEDVRFLLVLLAINALLSLRGGISWQGHLGGFVCGALLGLAFAYVPRNRATVVHALVFAAVWVLLLAGLVVRTAQLTT
jgi:membrane associated rhomboid family serine protease